MSEQSEALVVAGAFQIGGQEHAGQIRTLMVEQVHDHERDLAHDVYPAQLGIELERIENGDFVVHVRHVREVHVAVAFPHEAVTSPFTESVSVLDQ